MLKIQVLGKGLIPRGMGLAPRKNPFFADFTMISTILATPGLQVNYLNPETNTMQSLTPKNLQRVWNKYSEWKPKAPAEDPSRPHVPGGGNSLKKENEGDPVEPPAPVIDPPKGDGNMFQPPEKKDEQPSEPLASTNDTGSASTPEELTKNPAGESGEKKDETPAAEGEKTDETPKEGTPVEVKESTPPAPVSTPGIPGSGTPLKPVLNPNQQQFRNHGKNHK